MNPAASLFDAAMNELELIRLLTPTLPTNEAVVAGPGDDCAVLDLGSPTHHILFKTDAIVEGIHFTTDTQPERVGHKALARALSDVAAMGGEPVSALVTLALPHNFKASWVEALYAGMEQLARRYHVAISGGETTTNPERALISISLIGRVPIGRHVPRLGSQPGDALFVTGELGGSIEGHHLDFEPRLHESQWLTRHFPLRAMIDVSDGLASDLRHLLASPRIGADLLASAIPIRRAAKLRARQQSSAKPALAAALTDGEDFELLFTLPPQHAVPLLDAWKKNFPATPLSCIGKLTAQEGIRIKDKTGIHPLTAQGYVHFA